MKEKKSNDDPSNLSIFIIVFTCVIVVAILMVLTSCSTKTAVATDEPTVEQSRNRFYYSDDYHGGNTEVRAHVCTDTATGVQYLVIPGTGVTVLVDTDGTPLLNPKYE